MNEDSKWQQMAESVMQIFGGDGSINMDALNYLMNLALADEVMDDKEKNVLRGIFGQVPQDAVTPEVWSKIMEIKEKYSI